MVSYSPVLSLYLDDLRTYSNIIANLLQALRYFQKAEDGKWWSICKTNNHWVDIETS